MFPVPIDFSGLINWVLFVAAVSLGGAVAVLVAFKKRFAHQAEWWVALGGVALSTILTTMLGGYLTLKVPIHLTDPQSAAFLAVACWTMQAGVVACAVRRRLRA